MGYHSYYKCAGQRITRLYERGKNRLSVDVSVPGSGYMTQFDVGDWYVLDPYGDELSEKIRRRVFGRSKSWTIAIHRKDGRIAIAYYFTERSSAGSKHHCLSLVPWEDYRIPSQFLSQVDLLRSQKRPYSIYIDPTVLSSFIEREVGFEGMGRGVIFRFLFGPEILEVQGDFFRVCSSWRGFPSEGAGVASWT